MRRSWWIMVGAVLAVAGCQAPLIHNPNEANQVSPARQPDVVEAYMEQMAEDVIAPAVATAQITRERGDQLMVEGAKAYLDTVVFKDTPPEKVWLVAKAYMTAHEWDKAVPLVEQAIKVDTTGDRKVNDQLWLSRCHAELGHWMEAVKDARESFVAPPEWKWPILYAVQYEIVPACERDPKASRIELAHLVEDAIKQHEAATGSLDDSVRRSWIATRTYHLNKAWSLVIQLYTDAKRPDLARAAAQKATTNSQHPTTKTLDA